MRKNVIVLDASDFQPDYEDWAFLIVHTDMPSYLFADDLNHLYQLGLTRGDDLEAAGKRYPMFTFRDTARMLTYHLLEQPADTAGGLWARGQKLLMVRGKEAQSAVDAIHTDFSSSPRPAEPTDLLAASHNSLLETYQAVFTLTTPFSPGSAAPNISRRTRQMLADLTPEIDDILDSIDLSGQSG